MKIYVLWTFVAEAYGFSFSWGTVLRWRYICVKWFWISLHLALHIFSSANLQHIVLDPESQPGLSQCLHTAAIPCLHFQRLTDVDGSPSCLSALCHIILDKLKEDMCTCTTSQGLDSSPNPDSSLMTISLALPHWGHQNHLLTRIQLCKKQQKCQKTKNTFDIRLLNSYITFEPRFIKIAFTVIECFFFAA